MLLLYSMKNASFVSMKTLFIRISIPVLLFFFPSFVLAQVENEEMMLMQEGQWVPDSLKPIAQIKVLDGGFKFNCDYLQTINEALAKTQKKGANVLRIEEIQSPDVWSTCYRLWGSAYRIDDKDAYMRARIKYCYDIKQSLISDTAAYALVYFVRPANYYGSIGNFKVTIDDTLVLKVHNESKHVVCINNPGRHTIKVKNGSGSKEIMLERGVAYFFKLEVFKNMGIVMQQVLPDVGMYHLDKIKKDINKKG